MVTIIIVIIIIIIIIHPLLGNIVSWCIESFFFSSFYQNTNYCKILITVCNNNVNTQTFF